MPPLRGVEGSTSGTLLANRGARLKVFKRALRWSQGGNGEQRADDTLYVVGEKVLLRDKRAGDIAVDYSWRRDPELSRLDATRPMQMSFSDYRRYAREEIEHDSRWSRRFAIDTHDGRHIGNCMYYDVDERRGEAELGIMIGDREYWSQGYGTDAVNTLVDYIFTSTKLDRVYLHTLSWNSRARRCFAKAGFVEVRDVRRNSMDFVRMEVLRKDWEGSRRRRVDGEGDSSAVEMERRPLAAAPGVRSGTGEVEPVA